MVGDPAGSSMYYGRVKKEKLIELSGFVEYKRSKGFWYH